MEPSKREEPTEKKTTVVQKEEEKKKEKADGTEVWLSAEEREKEMELTRECVVSLNISSKTFLLISLDLFVKSVT